MREQVRELVQAEGMRLAVIIDDAYDPPVVSDVSQKGQAFVDCLRGDEDYGVVSDVLGVDDIDEDALLELLEQESAVRTIHEAPKDSLPTGAWDALFAEYEDAQSTKKAEIYEIVGALEDIGFSVSTRGTETQNGAVDVELVFVDLFFQDSLSAEDAADDARREGSSIPAESERLVATDTSDCVDFLASFGIGASLRTVSRQCARAGMSIRFHGEALVSNIIG